MEKISRLHTKQQFFSGTKFWNLIYLDKFDRKLRFQISEIQMKPVVTHAILCTIFDT